MLFVVLVLATTASVLPAQAQQPPPLSITRSTTVVAGLSGVPFRPDGADATSRILPAGSVMRAIGRTDDKAWLYVETELGSGWIAAEDVIVFGLDAVAVLPHPGGISDPVAAAEQNGNAAASPDPASSVEGESSSSVPASGGDSTSAISTPPTNSGTAAPAKDTQALQVAVSSSIGRLNVRSGPGIQYSVVDQVVSGTRLEATGRNSLSNWVQIIVKPDTAAQVGWVSARYLDVDDDLSKLPIAPADGQNAAQSAPQSSQMSTSSASGAGLRGLLVFQQSIGGTIYLYDLSSGSLRTLTAGAEPDLSPDRTTVVFTRGGGDAGLYLIDIDGSSERRIFSGRENLGSPKWSPDGKQILFSRGDEWLTCRRPGSREICTESNTVSEGQYRKLNYALAVVDSNGENYRDIVSQRPSSAPDWIDAGIVYQSTTGLQRTTADHDASNELIYYDYLQPFTYDPDWQPGGGAIVFQSNEGSHWQLFAVNADGSNRRWMTRPKTTLVDQLPSSVAPAWSPDGNYIVYLSNLTESGEAGQWKLWVMNADGSHQRPLPINAALEYTYGVEQVVSWR